MWLRSLAVLGCPQQETGHAACKSSTFADHKVEYELEQNGTVLMALVRGLRLPVVASRSWCVAPPLLRPLFDSRTACRPTWRAGCASWPEAHRKRFPVACGRCH